MWSIGEAGESLGLTLAAETATELSVTAPGIYWPKTQANQFL